MTFNEDDDHFVLAQRNEIARARRLFPDSQCAFVALIEEVGELGEAMLIGDTKLITGEAVQVAVMAQV